MIESVFITRMFNSRNECLSIYGVYTDLNKAIHDLTKNEIVEFDETRWVWEDTVLKYTYRIDEYTLQ